MIIHGIITDDGFLQLISVLFAKISLLPIEQIKVIQLSRFYILNKTLHVKPLFP